MSDERIPASRFKARCLALLDDVAESGQSLTVTKRGRAVARVVPMDGPPALAGSVTYLVSEKELIASLGEDWDADLS